MQLNPVLFISFHRNIHLSPRFVFFLNFNSVGKACNETQLSNIFHARLMPIPRTVIFHVNSFNFLSDLFVNAQIFSRHV
jgi:hypothetical protein